MFLDGSRLKTCRLEWSLVVKPRGSRSTDGMSLTVTPCQLELNCEILPGVYTVEKQSSWAIPVDFTLQAGAPFLKKAWSTADGNDRKCSGTQLPVGGTNRRRSCAAPLQSSRRAASRSLTLASKRPPVRSTIQSLGHSTCAAALYVVASDKRVP